MPDPFRGEQPAAPPTRPLRVGAYAGQRYPERPQWVELDGERVEVVEVEREWREEDRLGFAVKLRDNRRLLLYHVAYDDHWEGAEMTWKR